MERSKSFSAKWARLLEAAQTSTDSGLARVLDILPQSVTAARKREQIPGGWIESLSEKTGHSTDWLYFGTGPMRRDERVEQPGEAAPAGGTDGKDARIQEMAQRIQELEMNLAVAERTIDNVLRQLAKFMANDMIARDIARKRSEYNILGDDPTKKYLGRSDDEDEPGKN